MGRPGEIAGRGRISIYDKRSVLNQRNGGCEVRVLVPPTALKEKATREQTDQPEHRFRAKVRRMCRSCEVHGRRVRDSNQRGNRWP